MTTEIVSLVNTFEVIVESVSDNHVAECSMFACSGSLISSFRSAK